MMLQNSLDRNFSKNDVEEKASVYLKVCKIFRNFTDGNTRKMSVTCVHVT